MVQVIFRPALIQHSVICSQRRLVQQKKQRERERKDLDTLGRRHLANVRVVQRNVVYVVGIGPRFAKEEVRRSGSIYFAFWTHAITQANFHLTLKRLLRPVWPHIEDHHSKAHTSRDTSARRRVIHHISPQRRCCSLHCCSRWICIPRRWQRNHACELWYDQVLHVFLAWCQLPGSQLYESARVGG